MATYMIEINERTNKGKALRNFLECEDVVRLKPFIAGGDLLLREIATGLIDEKVEPNIRAYIWDNKDDINKTLLLCKERNEYEERKSQRQRELENQIKTFK